MLLLLLSFAATAEAIPEIVELLETDRIRQAEQAVSNAVAAYDDQPFAYFWMTRYARRHAQASTPLSPAEVALRKGEMFAILAKMSGFFGKYGLARKSRENFQHAADLEAQSPVMLRGMMIYYAQAPFIVGGSERKALDLAREIGELNSFEGALAFAAVDAGNGRLESAIEHYKQAVKQKPNDADAWFARAMTEEAAGQHSAALQSFDRVLEIEANHSQALFQSARIMIQQGERLALAEQRMARFIELLSTELAAWRQRACGYLTATESRHASCAQ